MKKIPTLFQRDETRRYVIDSVTPGCEWVLAGEGRATRKFDGTCVQRTPEGWWTRREVKPGKDAPHGFVFADYDEATGKTVGWEPAEQSSFWKYLQEATVGKVDAMLPTGTYELCGPKINGNPEQFTVHVVMRHGIETIEDDELPLDFEGLREWMQHIDFEGIVWHHPDGRMAKLKRRDFPRDATA